jgi:hypothetical protein
VLQRPGQDPFAELGDLLAILQHDRVLADQVDAADVAVQIYPDAGPIEPCRHLFDMRAFACAVIALNHHAAVMGEARQDRPRGFQVEAIGGVDIRNMVGAQREGRNDEIGVDAEHGPRRYRGIGQVSRRDGGLVGRVAGFGESDFVHPVSLYLCGQGFHLPGGAAAQPAATLGPATRCERRAA